MSHLDIPRRRLVSIAVDNLPTGVIVKVHSRCNLGCTYCYMYDKYGKPWRPLPRVMSYETINLLATRIREYMREVPLAHMNITLHGGEPLLAGMDTIRYIVETLRRAVDSECTLHFAMQTNATLVTDEVAHELAELGVSVGASLDGNEQGNILRSFRGGKSSYTPAVEGIKRLSEHRILSGILAVMNLDNDPAETAKSLLALSPNVDCLFPITKGWDDVEPTSRPQAAKGSTPYADWLIAFYRHWISAGGPVRGVRTIAKINDFIWNVCTGQNIPPQERVEWIGPWTPGDLVVETDGAIELLDGFNMVQLGASQTGLNIKDSLLMQGAVKMLETAEAWGLIAGSQTCQACQLYDVCGGGLYLHRFGPTHAYLNPSTYCADLQKLITSHAGLLWRLVQKEEKRDTPGYVRFAKALREIASA